MPASSPAFRLGRRTLGPEQPVYIIAEISANHRGRLEDALQLVEAARQAGADAVKTQTYTPDTITFRGDQPWFRIRAGSIWDGRSLHDLYAEAFTPWEWMPKIQAAASAAGLDFFSSCFDPTSVDFLEGLGVMAHKIASFELVDIPLVRKAAATGKPLFLSTGMASLAEIDEAVRAAREAGARGVCLMRCTSAYPAAPELMNLRSIPALAAAFQVPVGLSDHTLGDTAAIASVALGGCLIEKHLTLSRADGGPDAPFSLEPPEFARLVGAVRETHAALGSVAFAPPTAEAANRIFRRSLFAVRPIAAGEPFTPENVRSIRPANGLHPRHLSEVLRARARIDLAPGTPLAWNHLDLPPSVPAP